MICKIGTIGRIDFSKADKEYAHPEMDKEIFLVLGYQNHHDELRYRGRQYVNGKFEKKIWLIEPILFQPLSYQEQVLLGVLANATCKV